MGDETSLPPGYWMTQGINGIGSARASSDLSHLFLR